MNSRDSPVIPTLWRGEAYLNRRRDTALGAQWRSMSRTLELDYTDRSVKSNIILTVSN